jgi:hypothetical protein
LTNDEIYEDENGVLHMPDKPPSLEDLEPIRRPPGVKPIKWRTSGKGNEYLRRGKHWWVVFPSKYKSQQWHVSINGKILDGAFDSQETAIRAVEKAVFEVEYSK